MRTLLLTLAGTVILMLLGGLSGVIVAQDEDALASDRPRPVSGTAIYVRDLETGTTALEDGRPVLRGHMAYDTIEMDDARLSGQPWHIWNRDPVGGGFYSGVGEALTGTVELVNDDGSWVGTMRGYIVTEPTTHFWHIGLTGSGAYEGLSTLLYVKGPGRRVMNVDSLVFPGALPVYPDPVELPAE
jgi:hypothetical protein